MKRYYLAYGSNLNMLQMGFRCPDARAVGTAWITGYHLLFKGSKTGSYLTIEQKEGARVPVAVWEVSRADERNLDRYEGFPNFYYKKELLLTMKNLDSGRKQKVRAFVYIMHENRKPGIPTENYMRVCQEGYRDFGFSDRILRRAVLESWEALYENR